MNAPLPPTKVTMLRPDLKNIPQFQIPAGYTIRSYQPGDRAAWTGLWKAAEQDRAVVSCLFEKVFGSDDRALARRQLFLCDRTGRAVGTATAWYHPRHHGQRFGRIHYLAVHPSVQGRGLAKPLLTRVCNRLAELGHTRAFLATETFRLRAIRLYLEFGFRPEIRHRQDLLAWGGLLQQGLPVGDLEEPA